MGIRTKPPYLDGERLDCSIPATAMARLTGFRERLGLRPGQVVGALLRALPDDQAEAFIRDMVERDERTCAAYREIQRGS